MSPKRVVMIGFGRYAKKSHFKQVEYYSNNKKISLEAVFVGKPFSTQDKNEILALNPNCAIMECADIDATENALRVFLKDKRKLKMPTRRSWSSNNPPPLAPELKKLELCTTLAPSIRWSDNTSPPLL